MIDESGVERKDCLVHMRDDVEFTSSDGIFMKGMLMPTKGTLVAQHSHNYEHTSVVACGAVRVWKDEVFFGDFKAPAFIIVEKLVKHKFQSLEDNTSVYCIHQKRDELIAEASTDKDLTLPGGV